MNETLISLLLQLSEAGAPASLWGRRAKPHFGRGFDRMLASRVLVEQAPAEFWSTCETCDCDLMDRPIERIGERILAVLLSDNHPAGTDNQVGRRLQAEGGRSPTGG
jgi:hypothetical protein